MVEVSNSERVGMMQGIAQTVASSARRALRTDLLEHRIMEIGSSVEEIRRTPSGNESASSKISQLILANQFREARDRGGKLPELADVEFRAFSQNGEDGILLYVFTMLGMGERRCLEIC